MADEPRYRPVRELAPQVVAVAALCLVACNHDPDGRSTESLPIAVPKGPATLEEIVALALDYTEERYAPQVWLHHVNAPAVRRDGTVSIDDHRPIEVTFTIRQAHSREVCQTLQLTNRGWTGSHRGCDYHGVQARCTAREVIARAEMAGLPGKDAVTLRLYERPSTEAVEGAELWTVEASTADSGTMVTVADDCGEPGDDTEAEDALKRETERLKDFQIQ